MALQILGISLKKYFQHFIHCLPFGIIYGAIGILPILLPHITYLEYIVPGAAIVFAEIPLYMILYRLFCKNSPTVNIKSKLLQLLLFIIVDCAVTLCFPLLIKAGISLPAPGAFLLLNLFLRLFLISIIKNGVVPFFGIFSNHASGKLWLILKIVIIEHLFTVVTALVLGLIFILLPKPSDISLLYASAVLSALLLPYLAIRTWFCHEAISSEKFTDKK